jgi:hypothetical protein
LPTPEELRPARRKTAVIKKLQQQGNLLAVAYPAQAGSGKKN